MAIWLMLVCSVVADLKPEDRAGVRVDNKPHADRSEAEIAQDVVNLGGTLVREEFDIGKSWSFLAGGSPHICREGSIWPTGCEKRPR